MDKQSAIAYIAELEKRKQECKENYDNQTLPWDADKDMYWLGQVDALEYAIAKFKAYWNIT